MFILWLLALFMQVIFSGFISHLIGRETINIPEIFSGVHGFTGKTVSFQESHTKSYARMSKSIMANWSSWFLD